MSAQGGFVPQGKLPTDVPNLVAWWNSRDIAMLRDVDGNPITSFDTPVRYWDDITGNWTLSRNNTSQLQRLSSIPQNTGISRPAYFTDPTYNVNSGLNIGGETANAPDAMSGWCDIFNTSKQYTIIICETVYDNSSTRPYGFALGSTNNRSSFIGFAILNGVKKWRINPTFVNTNTQLTAEPRIFPDMPYFEKPAVIAATTNLQETRAYVNGQYISSVYYATQPYDIQLDPTAQTAGISSIANIVNTSSRHSVCVFDRALTDEEIYDISKYMLKAYTIDL